MRVSREIIRTALMLVESDENAGVCMACGEVCGGVEPDARKYECEACGEPQVYGAEEILLSASLKGEEEEG